MSATGFRFEVTYADHDLMRVRVSASNGIFCGAADVYIGIGQMQQTARVLKGFPDSPNDSREVTLGAFGPASAGGAVKMRFYCGDRAGHAFVDSTIESDYDGAGKVQSVRFILALEATALDSFVEEIERLDRNRAGRAYLNGTDATG